MDALKSFTFLTDNIPQWLTKIDKLSEYTSKKQAEFAAEYTRLTHPKVRKHKTNSVHSIRSSIINRDEQQPPATTTVEDPIDQHPELNPLDIANRYLFANARRKRKNAGTSVRSGASGPAKYRHRHMVVVYYDSSVQEDFETLVRVIGGARNNLRKGRMAQVMKNGFELPALTGHASPLESFNVSPLDLKSSHRNGLDPKYVASVQVSVHKTTGGSVFDEADKDLEAAQSLCEVGSHQFLRDGDCSLEIDGTREKLERVLMGAKAEKLRLEEQEKQEKEMEEAEKTVREAEELDKRRTAEGKDQVVNIGTGDAEIEVDDGDSAEAAIEMDLSAFRSTRQRVRA